MKRASKYAIPVRPGPGVRHRGPAPAMLSLQKISILGVAFLLLALFAALSWFQRQSARVERLLNRAYTERRTMEARIPGAGYVPLLSTRGNNSHVDTSPSLLEAEVKIQEALKT